MVEYPINKGVGRSVEVKGLRAQYFIYAVIGVVLAFLVFLILSFITNQLLASLAAILCLTLNISACFILNRKFGEHGLVQLYARRRTPDRINVGKRVYKIISKK